MGSTVTALTLIDAERR